jgi:hypothetical protein
MGELHATLGIAGADAAVLLGMMEGVSGESRETLLNQMKIVGELAQAAGVAPAAVMADVAANTDLWADYAQDGGENIMEAAIQAKALGLNLGVVSKMADSLLDFETSIQDSMEASMMLGRNINTDRARQLALEGDLAGMQKEILSQVGSEAEFNQMNILQRQALAKAFGLSTGELSKMVREQETLNERWGLTSWVLAQIGKLTGMFRKLRPILEVIAVVLGTLILPALIKIGVKGIQNLMAEISLYKVKHGLSLKQLATDARDIALKMIKLPLLARDLVVTLASNIAKRKDIALSIASTAARWTGVASLWAYITAQTVATGGAWAFAAALLANPITWIVLGVVALIAGIVLLAKKVGGFGKLASMAFKMAFAPLFLAWEAMKMVGNFIGGLFGGGKKEPAAASPAVAMADGGVVNSATTAKIGEAGPEAVVPLGDKFDLSGVEDKLDLILQQDLKLMNTLTGKIKQLGVEG